MIPIDLFFTTIGVNMQPPGNYLADCPYIELKSSILE